MGVFCGFWLVLRSFMALLRVVLGVWMLDMVWVLSCVWVCGLWIVLCFLSCLLCSRGIPCFVGIVWLDLSFALCRFCGLGCA